MYMGLDGVELARIHKAWLLTRTAGRKETHRQYYVAEHGLQLSIGEGQSSIAYLIRVVVFIWDVERRLSL